MKLQIMDLLDDALDSVGLERKSSRIAEPTITVGAILLAGVGIGAGLMFLLDPSGGRRRRAMVSDKASSALNSTTGSVSSLASHANNRAHGIGATLRNLVRGKSVVPEHVLVERVRSEIGRLVKNPRSITINAFKGKITLSGPIMADEVRAIVRKVKAIPGVGEVVNNLEVHEHLNGARQESAST